MKISLLLTVAVFIISSFIFISCGPEDSTETVTDSDSISDKSDDTGEKNDAEDLCGNKIIDNGEECDSFLKKCVEVNPDLYTGGNALCNEDCTFDVSGCLKVEETPDYNVEQPDNEVPDEGDPSDIISGFSNNPDCQCSVDRNDVCTKADYDAWSGAPVPAPQNKNVSRLCIGGVWVWAPFSTAGSASECTESDCLPGEARQFLQAGAAGFCVCLNKCSIQGDDAENKACGTGRTCAAVDDATGTQVHVCGGHQ